MTPLDVIEGQADWCVVHGDCLEVLPTLPDRSVAHVITDPPYEAEAHTHGRRVKRVGIEPENAGAWVDRCGTPRVETLPFAPITDFHRDSSGLHIGRLAARWSLVFCQVEAAHRWALAMGTGGAKYRRTCVWVKPDGQPQFSGDRPGMGYESIVVAHAPGRSHWNGGGRVGVFVHNKQQPTDSHYGVEHPTRKPIGLMLELVELFTDPGDIVLDPFAGSGTTGVACLRLGRRFIGIEKDAAYHQIAVDRLTAETRGQSLREFRSGQLSLLADAKP